MCILYKQQMQQYSDNTSSRSYRNAVKDYKNNCSNPPPATTPQAQPASVVVAPKAHDDDKVKSVLETQSSTVNPLDSNLLVTKSEPVEVQREASIIVENVENVENVESSQVKQNSSAEITVEPATIKVTAPEPVRAEPDSLVMPSLLLLVVLLLAAMLLLRLRANKKAAVETAPLIPATDEASITEAAAVSKLTSVLAAPAVGESTVSPKKAVIAEQVAITTPQTEVASSDDMNVKVELTQRFIKNKHDFKEPEVRMFDPDAPLPGQQPQQPKGVIKPATINVEADLEINLEPQQTSTTEQHSASEHDERDDISGASETDSALSKTNSFANLSLDPSWDPNSKEKPTIVPKKTVPKSAKLIAAQERAKQLKIDD
ncbi:hypothetical protein [Pseudoalteromonas arctica]|uniref:Uncharacterized protein n=1 Tax=Pseudoalteromonas arctica TaxID=394751 RepID=A0A7Y0HB92_9GAMM|nr:hypothetical protein [Pseudoalteromonas arctica]NMM39622.1 hypothetical protein [Pseudoalteromonas arctica]